MTPQTQPASAADVPGSVVETLRAARALIEDPKRWTKGALAKTGKRADDEHAVSPSSPQARAWCAVGAITRIDGEHESAALILLATAIDGSGNEYVSGTEHARDDIVDFNDTRNRRHKEVMRAFDRAIAKAEAVQ